MDPAVRLQKEPSHIDIECAAGDDWPVNDDGVGNVVADDRHLLPVAVVGIDVVL